MIVGGSFGTIKMLWMLWRQVNSRRYERLDARNRPPRPTEDGLSTSAGSRITNFLLTSFLVVWFVLGNLWILGIYWPAFEPTLRDPNRWCHKTLYVFSLVHLAVIYSLLGVVMLTILVMVACQLCVCSLLVSCKQSFLQLYWYISLLYYRILIYRIKTCFHVLSQNFVSYIIIKSNSTLKNKLL